MAPTGIAKGTKTRYFQRVRYPTGQKLPNTAANERKSKPNGVAEEKRKAPVKKSKKKTNKVQPSAKRQSSKSKSKPKYNDMVKDENRLHPNYAPDDPYDDDYEDVDDDYYEDPVIDPDPDVDPQRQVPEDANRKKPAENQKKKKPAQKPAQTNRNARTPSTERKQFNVKEKQNGGSKGKAKNKPQRRVAGGKKGSPHPVWRNVGDPTRRAFISKWSSDFKGDDNF